MLKFSVLHGTQHHPEGANIVVDAGERLECVLELEPPHVGMPDSWTVWVLDLGDVGKAASRCHALEIGITAAARWIAVELLANPAQGKKREGVELYLSDHDIYNNQQLVLVEYTGEIAATLGLVFSTQDYVSASPRVGSSRYRDHGDFATLEQAIAVLIEHGAPWVAAALEKQIVAEESEP